MGHHARTLTALLAVLATTLVVTSTAGAYSSVVRAETRQMNSVSSGAFIPRVAVETGGPVTITDATNPTVSEQCPADSPIAAIIAAVGIAQVKVIKDTTTGKWLISSLKNVSPGTLSPSATPPVTPPWYWRVYIDMGPIDRGGNWDAGDVCASPEYPSAGAEVLVYQACGTANGNTTRSCFGQTPLYMRVRDGGLYDIARQSVPGRNAPVVVTTIAEKSRISALVATDESSFKPVESTINGPLLAQTAVSFTEYGNHTIIAVEKAYGDRPPARVDVCVTEGNDGYCGSTRYQPPDDVPYDPSPCATNGHDGLCGTTDTSGPITHVTNITQKKQFKKKKGPGQVTGTIDVDPNAVKYVKLRLTRVTTSRVLIKTKKKSKAKKSALATSAKAKKKAAKKRYKTVKRCTAWDDTTALLETAKCGTKYAKWFDVDLNDLRNAFSYSFAMTLPAGTYTLEVEAADENGFKDLPAAGRNLLTFTVL